MQRENGLSEFAETLVTALKKIGYRNIPRLENLNDLKQRYKNYSSMEMAKKFAQENNLEQTTVLFKLLKKIENLEPINIAETAKQLGVRDRNLSYALNNFSEIEASGNARAKKFFYVGKEPLSMKTAEHLLSLVNNMRTAKLRQADKDLLDAYIKEGKTYLEFKAENDIKKDKIYVAENYFHAKKSQKKLQEQKKPIVTEAKFKVPKNGKSAKKELVPEVEMAQEVLQAKETVQAQEIELVKDASEIKTEQLSGERLLIDVLKKQMVFFEQKIKFLEAKVKGQDEFITYLIEQLEIENQ